jgi:hypothetical protein
MQSLIDSAHAQGVRFACSTLTPWEGSSSWTAARETVRQGINVNLALFTPVSLSTVTAPTGCGAFQPGNGLKPGQTLQSCDGRFTLILQNDGNLVLYKESAQPLWATGTVNRDSAQLELTPSGDFVLYGKLGESLWRSGNAGQTAAQAFLQGDGNLVIYGPTSAVWASNTAGQ